MNHSSLLFFSFVLVLNLSLIGANIRIPRSGYNPSPYEDVVTNIGNGVGRRNVFVISDTPTSGVTTQSNWSPGLENRFGDSPDTINPTPPRRTVNNYGNGYNNHNTFNLNSSGRTRPTQSSGYNGGTTFAGTSTFHVGYGSNNHNFINGRPVQPAPAVNSGGKSPVQQNFANGGVSFASRSGTLYNMGIGKNNQNSINFKDIPNQPVSRKGGSRNPQPQSTSRTANNDVYSSNTIDQVTVNGKPIQPDHTSASGFKTYHVPGGRTVSVLSTSGGNRSPTNSDIQQLTKIRALSSQMQQISSKISQEAARRNIQL